MTPNTCSLGFITSRSGELGIVTAAHCTTAWARVDSDVAYQPTSGASNRIGVETIDPPFFTNAQNPNCPPGKQCRHSDSAFVKLDAGVDSNRGFIAKPTVQNDGTAPLTHSPFRITSEGNAPVMNETLHKVGRTTGWKSGPVVATCTNEGPGDILFLCQDIVDTSVEGGDSGSTVFKITNSPLTDDVAIKGIVWATSGTRFIMSYIGNIYLDLGSQATWDTCAPGFGC